MWALVVSSWLVAMAGVYASRNLRMDATYVKSSIDDETYLVLKGGDKNKAANMLGKVKLNMDKLIKHLSYVDIPERKEAILRLMKRYKHLVLVESPWQDDVTSYTTNKGEEIALCLRSKEEDNLGEIHEIDMIMYVAIHEMAHVMAESYIAGKSHNAEFYDNFGFLLSVAREKQLIDKTDYASVPEMYCGLRISEKII